MSEKIEKKMVEGITKESTQEAIDEVLKLYPEKGKKKRAPHLAPNDQLSGKACVNRITSYNVCYTKLLRADFKERARQAKFLQYRGFEPDQIRAALDMTGE